MSKAPMVYVQASFDDGRGRMVRLVCLKNDASLWRCEHKVSGKWKGTLGPGMVSRKSAEAEFRRCVRNAMDQEEQQQ